MSPTVVLIPVYGNRRGLEISLESLGQAHGAFDILIVDDGSPEAIDAPLKLANRNPVTVLRLSRNRGIAHALNHGLRYILERGYEYVARLDSGDVVAADRFVQQAEYLGRNRECAAVSSFVDFIDPAGSVLFRHRAPSSPRGILRRLHIENCVMHPGVMLRVSVLQQEGLYREDVPGAEDYELFLRMAVRHELGVIPRVLTRCEYSRTGLSIAGRRRQQEERLRLQVRYFDAVSPWSYLGIGRTLLGMILPHRAVFHWKRACARLSV